MPVPIHTQREAERGAAIVEAAIILMVLFFVLFGIMEAGRFVNVQQVVTDATREGARLAVAPFSGTNAMPGDDDVIGIVNQFLASANVAPADIPSGSGASPTTVEIAQEASDGTAYTRVTVTTPYRAMLPLFAILEIPVVGDVRMRNETSN